MENKKKAKGNLIWANRFTLNCNYIGEKTIVPICVNNLSSKLYKLYQIIQRIGRVAYKLQLPISATIHLVFHVSQLKKSEE